MQCISPILVTSKKRRDFVPCGKCNFCLQTRRAEWTFRLEQEQKICETSTFITLTYDEEKLPISEDNLPTLRKRDITLFVKRIRKANALLVSWPFRYYLTGEYGENTARPHYHILAFNLHPGVIQNIPDYWTDGLTHQGQVETASIHYVTKYIINRVGQWNGRSPPFVFMSKRPGIGANYLNTHKQWHLNGKRNYTEVHGVKGRLPRYYAEKIFSKTQRSAFRDQYIIESDLRYFDTINRLADFHSDPYNYLDERIRSEHEKITELLKNKNQLQL